jgi:hypothetical protein
VIALSIDSLWPALNVRAALSVEACSCEVPQPSPNRAEECGNSFDDAHRPLSGRHHFRSVKLRFLQLQRRVRMALSAL